VGALGVAALSAYASAIAIAIAIGQFDNRDLAKAAASILADESMHWAVLRLPEPFRCVLVLRAVAQLSVAETAQLLDIPEATVKTRLHRARGLLQEQLPRQLGARCGELFEFAGDRCERLVRALIARLPR